MAFHQACKRHKSPFTVMLPDHACHNGRELVLCTLYNNSFAAMIGYQWRNRQTAFLSVHGSMECSTLLTRVAHTIYVVVMPCGKAT